MTYVFIRYYNPTYDFFLSRYFRDGGLDVDENLTLEKADSMAAKLQWKKDKTPQEKLFLSYVSTWNNHPKYRPARRFLLEKIFGEKVELDVKQFRELESQLGTGMGKLLLSQSDVATQISDFYTGYFRTSLRKDLEHSAEDKEFYKYIEPEDFSRLPDLRRVGPARYYMAVKQVASELLPWLDAVTPQKVLDSVEYVVDEHSGTPNHLRAEPHYNRGKKKILSCEHRTQYLYLDGFLGESDDFVSLSVAPTRGTQVCENGDEIAVRPWYDVKEVP